jgi:hypothetical protein
MVCPKSNSHHVYKLKKVGHRRAYSFLFCYLGSKEVLGGVPNVSKKVVMGQSMCLLSNKKRKKKECGCTYELINMNHMNKREAPSLHDLTSHWLHGNSIPKIGCHYFWPRLSNSPS